MPITIKEITAHDRGALFYAADLHIHSYGASEDVTDKTLTIESIVDNAFKHSIGVLSITDHNTARNVAPSIEYAASMPAKCSSLPASKSPPHTATCSFTSLPNTQVVSKIF